MVRCHKPSVHFRKIISSKTVKTIFDYGAFFYIIRHTTYYILYKSLVDFLRHTNLLLMYPLFWIISLNWIFFINICIGTSLSAFVLIHLSFANLRPPFCVYIIYTRMSVPPSIIVSATDLSTVFIIVVPHNIGT